MASICGKVSRPGRQVGLRIARPKAEVSSLGFRMSGQKITVPVAVMNVDVSTAIVIDRPREVVSSYSADPGNAPVWYVNIEAVEWRTPPPAGVGSRLAFVAHFLGRRLVYTYEIVELAPGERLVMRTAEGPFPMETTYTWESTAGGATRMTLRNRGTPAGFSRLVAPFIARAIGRANRKDLARLKNILEAAST